MITIFTDTLSELKNFPELTYGLGIQFVDVQYFFDDGSQADGLLDFYKQLRAGKMARTASLPPEDFKDAFRPFLATNHDILYIGLSTKLTGTKNSFEIAKADLQTEFPDRRIEYFDSLSLSFGVGFLAYKAARMNVSGFSYNEIWKALEEERDKVAVLFTVESLKWLQKGGRISKMTSAIGGFLNIKPIISVNENGEIVSSRKAIGKRKALLEIVKLFKANYRETETKSPIAVIHADSENDAKFLAKEIEKITKQEVLIGYAAPTIGAHCGPGGLGVIFPSNKKL